MAHAAERGRDIGGDMAIHLSNEAQSQVQLVVILPTGAGNAAHASEQPRADCGGWANGDEEPVHDQLFPNVAGLVGLSGFP